MIQWDKLTAKDSMTIGRIVDRASEVFAGAPKMTIMMDISACHISNPLRLEDLLGADEFNFMHDVLGIYRHIDRDTGALKNSFSPRFSA